MPGFDGTGPMGRGSMTGGARGYCNPNAQPLSQRGSSPRRGGARGRGRGFRNMFWATGLPGWARYGQGGYGSLPDYGYGPYSKEQEVTFLKKQAGYLKDELSAIDSRLQDLESQ